MGRFKFRSFAERVDAVDIDVFRRLDAVKFEPEGGFTSFFHESLIRWRELNAAREFVDLYVELLPLVQTLPQLLLHKNTVLDRLLSCLQPSAALSLEPIIGLIAVLARDLAQDFVQLIPQIFDGFHKLLQLGGDKDSTILEMVFTNLAYIFKYMQKFLSKDVVFVLKVTKKFRFYAQDYVRAFAAEAVSFLFRNAPLTQIIKGVRKAISEAERDASDVKISASSSLLTFTLKGPSHGFHSRAEELLKLLLNQSILGGIRQEKGEVAVDILKQLLSNLVEDIHFVKLELLWSCLLEEIPPALSALEDESGCNQESKVIQATRLLMLVNHLLEQKKLPTMNDNKSLIGLALRLLNLLPRIVEKLPAEFLSQIFSLLLNSMKKRVDASIRMPAAASLWSSAFETSPLSSIFPFIERLVDQETEAVVPFVSLILRGLERSFESYQVRTLEVLVTLFDRHGVKDVESTKLSAAVCGFIEASLAKLKDGQSRHQTFEEAEVVWRALQCFPYLIVLDTGHSVCLDYATAIDHFLSTEGSLSEQDAEVWMALLGASLLSHVKTCREKARDVCYLQYALKYFRSVHVLEAVAYFASLWLSDESGSASFPVELNHQSFIKDCKVLQTNLGASNRKLRLATLKFLSLYEQTDLSNQNIQDLLSIETMLLEPENSSRIISLILHMKIRAKPAELAGVVFHAMVGVLQNRVTSYWDPAIDCLVKSFEDYKDAVPDCLSYLSSTQARCFAERQSNNGFNKFWESVLHDSQFITPVGSITTSLLRILQKVSSRFVSKSGELVSLFLDFVDFKAGSEHSINGKEWSLILKNWLQLLSQLKNIHALPNGPSLKEVLIDRFLVFNDPDVQRKALDCVLSWKDAALTAYKDHLYSLISNDDLRDELTVWSVERENQQVADEHRELLIPVLLRILYPKLSKRKTKRATPARTRMRSCILSFLSFLDVGELVTLFFLIIRPLETAFSPAGLSYTEGGKPAWRHGLEGCDPRNFIDFVDGRKVADLPLKRKIGFLQLAKELIDSLDGEHIEPYLPAMMAFVIRILESASLKPETNKDQKNVADKDLRTMCLKLLSLLLHTFHNVDFSTNYRDVLFDSIEHSIQVLTEENAHSDRPSALLCFCLELSEDETLTSLLLKNKLLVPNIFSLLLVDNLSAPVQSAVLNFIENLLAMKRETMELTLVPYLKLLLQGLTKQLTRKKPTSKNEKTKQYLKQHLQILSRLSRFIDDCARASEFLDIMLLFLTTKEHVDSEIRIEVLTILRELSILFDADSRTKCVQAFTPLLSSTSSQDARRILCECLEKLSNVDTSLSLVAKILVDLNSMSTSRIDECDYDRRQMAYGKLDQLFLSELDACQTSLLISQIVFDLESEDMRYNASSCLVTFVRAAAEGGLRESQMTYDVLFSRITNAMKSENSAIRREWIIIFRELVHRATVPTFLEFQCLTNSDVEVDFFSNIIHVQVHRRIKAMAKFRAACNIAPFSQHSLAKLFVPLFLHSLFEVRASKDGNLVDATIETIGCVAARLKWKPAVKLVMDLFRMLSSRSEHQKILVRLICLLLGKTQVSWTETASKEGEAGRMPASILEEKVLPQLDKLMLTADSVNVPVALATVKVLQLMPDELVTKNYPRICQTITNLLKSRIQQTRDEARAAIVGMVEILGARYLQFTVKMLHASLKRGYEKHVLGYTVNAILIRVVPQFPVGAIDYCIDDLMLILEEEFFGEVSEEKEVEALTRKMKERKQARSYDSLRLIAQSVTFADHIHRLLSLVRQHKAPSSAILEKLQLVLKSVASGLQDNPSASDEGIMSYVRGLLQEFLSQNDGATRSKGGSQDSSCNMHMLSEFGLNILCSRLKNQLTAKDPGQLDTFVQPLQRCLLSKFDGVVSGAMKCLSFLLRLALPSIAIVGEAIVKAVFLRASSSSSSGSPLMQSCVKLLTVLLRHCKNVTLSEAEVHELLHLNIFVDIDSQDTQALSLLKAAVERKLVVPELYDLMDRVQTLMVTSQAASIRQRCSEILLQYLLDYPLGSKRLQRHFNFLLANLGYEHISGREAALEMLHTVIVKFPDAVIEEQSNSLFLTLITRLGNDRDNSVQVLLETVLKVLMERVSAQSLEHMKEFMLSWMNGDNQSLWLPATQGTRVLVEVMDKNFDRHFINFWPAVLKILYIGSSSDQSLDDVTRAVSWKVTYNVLLLIEKLFQHLANRLNNSCSEETWTVIQHYLLHKNLLVRKAAARLLAIYIGNASEKSAKHDLPNVRSKFLMLAAIFCEQMTSPTFDEELGHQVTEDLIQVATVLFSIGFRTEDLQDERVVQALSMLKGKSSSMTIDHLTKLAGREDFSVIVLIFQRLSNVPLENAQAKTILNWYPSAVNRLQKLSSVQAYLPYILRNILKVERSTAPADLKTCAEGVRHDIRELVGPENFATAYNQVSQELKSRKENRKRAQSIAALVDPETNARKKIKLGRKKLAQKKRKRSEMSKH